MPSMHKFNFLNDRFNTVIITGGSSGIGKCFVNTIRQLTPSMTICNLSRTRPDDFPEDGPLFQHIPTDMANPAAVSSACKRLQADLAALPAGAGCLLINNAGFGSYGAFAEQNPHNECELLDTNVRGLVQFTGELLPQLRRTGGTILNVSSTAAWQPTPFMATYGASKAFLLQWSLALDTELKPHGVRVCALCPGPTESNFFRRAGFKEAPIAGWGQPAQAVVDCALHAIRRNRPLAVSGWSNKLMVALSSRLPRAWQAPIAGKVLRALRLERMQ